MEKVFLTERFDIGPELSRAGRSSGNQIRGVAVALLFFALTLLNAGAAASYKVLVFSATAGFRHDSITNGIAAIQALGSTNGFAVDATEDATAFSDANLA